MLVVVFVGRAWNIFGLEINLERNSTELAKQTFEVRGGVEKLATQKDVFVTAAVVSELKQRETMERENWMEGIQRKGKH